MRVFLFFLFSSANGLRMKLNKAVATPHRNAMDKATYESSQELKTTFKGRVGVNAYPVKMQNKTSWFKDPDFWFLRYIWIEGDAWTSSGNKRNANTVVYRDVNEGEISKEREKALMSSNGSRYFKDYVVNAMFHPLIPLEGFWDSQFMLERLDLLMGVVRAKDEAVEDCIERQVSDDPSNGLMNSGIYIYNVRKYSKDTIAAGNGVVENKSSAAEVHKFVVKVVSRYFPKQKSVYKENYEQLEHARRQTSELGVDFEPENAIKLARDNFEAYTSDVLKRPLKIVRLFHPLVKAKAENEKEMFLSEVNTELEYFAAIERRKKNLLDLETQRLGNKDKRRNENLKYWSNIPDKSKGQWWILKGYLMIMEKASGKTFKEKMEKYVRNIEGAQNEGNMIEIKSQLDKMHEMFYETGVALRKFHSVKNAVPHGDFHPGNIMVSSGDGISISIIDVGLMGTGENTLYDVAMFEETVGIDMYKRSKWSLRISTEGISLHKQAMFKFYQGYFKSSKDSFVNLMLNYDPSKNYTGYFKAIGKSLRKLHDQHDVSSGHRPSDTSNIATGPLLDITIKESQGTLVVNLPTTVIKNKVSLPNDYYRIGEMLVFFEFLSDISTPIKGFLNEAIVIDAKTLKSLQKEMFAAYQGDDKIDLISTRNFWTREKLDLSVMEYKMDISNTLEKILGIWNDKIKDIHLKEVANLEKTRRNPLDRSVIIDLEHGIHQKLLKEFLTNVLNGIFPFRITFEDFSVEVTEKQLKQLGLKHLKQLATKKMRNVKIIEDYENVLKEQADKQKQKGRLPAYQESIRTFIEKKDGGNAEDRSKIEGIVARAVKEPHYIFNVGEYQLRYFEHERLMQVKNESSWIPLQTSPMKSQIKNEVKTNDNVFDSIKRGKQWFAYKTPSYVYGRLLKICKFNNNEGDAKYTIKLGEFTIMYTEWGSWLYKKMDNIYVIKEKSEDAFQMKASLIDKDGDMLDLVDFDKDALKELYEALGSTDTMPDILSEEYSQSTMDRAINMVVDRILFEDFALSATSLDQKGLLGVFDYDKEQESLFDDFGENAYTLRKTKKRVPSLYEKILKTLGKEMVLLFNSPVGSD